MAAFDNCSLIQSILFSNYLCSLNATNQTENFLLLPNDAAWILSNTFRILGMQTGFGMLEAGMVSSKNIANIMVKNVMDVTVGGFTYWIFGYALSFGKPSNWFCGYGNFFFNADDRPDSGSQYTKFFFHFSFATASTTIISGAAAERMKLTSYILFSAVNTIIYCIPASWAWHDTGFLKGLGFFDFAGAGTVHLTGGASSLVAALMLGPRLGRFKNDGDAESPVSTMSSPVTSLVGMFTLWWAWFAFNCGSTFGISNDLWRIAAKVAVTTTNGSIGGSLAGLLLTVIVNRKKLFFDVGYLINSILGGLVAITAGCAVIGPAESMFIGFIGGAVAIGVSHLQEKLKIDDPVGAVPVHFATAIWALAAVGLFGKNQYNQLSGHSGLVFGGGIYLFFIQLVGAGILTVWSMGSTYLTLLVIKKTMGIRMKPRDEILGADWVEHRIQSENFAKALEAALAVSQLKSDQEKAVVAHLFAELQSSKREGHIVDYGIRGFGRSQATMATEILQLSTAKPPPHSPASVNNEEDCSCRSNRKKKGQKMGRVDALPGTIQD